MTALATDNFNRANSGTLGANWTTTAGDGSADILSNEAGAELTAATSVDYNNTVSWPNDGYAQATLKTVNTVSDNGMGPAYRVTSGGDLYFSQATTVEIRLYKRVSGGYTQLGSDGAAGANGDLVRIECSGTSILVKKNGSTIVGAVTDSGISAGNAGLWSSTQHANASVDDWEGGSLTAAAQQTLMLLGVGS